MVHHALHDLDPAPDSVLFIENVGNLVCPALFDLGEHCKVVIISVTEGTDKPLKYPHMFAAAGLVLINKTDLLPVRRLRPGRVLGLRPLGQSRRRDNPGLGNERRRPATLVRLDRRAHERSFGYRR